MSEPKIYRFYLDPSVILSVKHEIKKVFECHAINVDLNIIDDMVNKLDWNTCCTSHDDHIEGLQKVKEYKEKEEWKNDDYKVFCASYKGHIENKIFKRLEQERKERREERRKLKKVK